MMGLLPKHDLWDRINIPGVPVPTGENVPRRPFLSLICKHARSAPYTRVDYRGGPGCFADAHEGKVCLTCGKVTEERQVY